MSKLRLTCVFVIAGVLAVACDDGSSGGGGSYGTFDVALADNVSGTSGGLVRSNAGGGQVNAMAFHVLEAKQAAGKAIEVWITAPDYFDADGRAKAKDGEWASNRYTVKWGAYDPITPTKSASGPAENQVLITKSKTDENVNNVQDPARPGRMKVTVGSDLLNERGAVVVVLVYDPIVEKANTGLNVSKNLVARFELKITKAPNMIDLTGLSVSAKGAAVAAGAGVATATAAVLPAAVSTTAGFTVGADKSKATVTLELDATVRARFASSYVVFNTFQVGGPTPSWLVGGWTIAKGTDVGTTTAVSPAQLASASAYFTANDPADRGQVVLTGKDRYGQEAKITVTLDPLYKN